ncbi:RHS repeat protein [Yersinia pestis]|nr:RHS repeat-associated core domain-containing protein [Yersinia pestis]TNV24145.1 RHS repeat protein [Yersinia pestis]TNV28486.1 RHS repeat protein [Yersinia pestis]
MQDQVLAQQTWHCDALSSTLVGTVSYGYDGAGRLLSATNADAVVEFDYDEAGQLVAERLNGREVRHQWDALNGTPVARQVGELGLTFVYGAQGELTRLQLAGHQPLQLQHDRLGRETVRESAAGFIQACNYTPSGLLAHQAAGRNSALFQQQLIAPESPALHGSAVNRSWQYDRAYNVVGMDDGRWGKTQYQYDRNDQVVRADFGGFLPLQEQFSYDVNQNLREHRCLPRGAQAVLAQASQQQQAGRVVKRGDSQYRYDAAGRLVEKRSQKDGYRPQLWRYRWNEQDQLSELITPTGARWRYGYDAFGRRIRKLRVVDTPPLNEMDAPSTGPATASLAGYAYLWSGDQLIEEVPVYADGTVAYEQGIHWLYAPGGLTPMARYAQGKLHYVVADHLGTPRELLNEQGKVVWASRLSTWGQAELWRQAANEEDRVSCNLRFAGQYADAESGLHYNRFRYYDGETGQYLCPDPIGLEGGLNPYGYVHNPVSWVDPLGLATCPMREVNGTKIFGKGQKDGTPGHDQFSEVIANKLAMSGKFKEVYLNRSYNFANGKGISGRRPDIMAVDMNGKVHAIELASKTDMGRKFPSLRTRNQDAMKNLPSIDRGSVIVLEHQYNSSKIKNALDNLISGI